MADKPVTGYTEETLRRQEIPPCPVPGCGHICALMKTGPKIVFCPECKYTAPSLAAHKQFCGAMELVERMCQIDILYEWKETHRDPGEWAKDTILVLCTTARALRGGQ